MTILRSAYASARSVFPARSSVRRHRRERRSPAGARRLRGPARELSGPPTRALDASRPVTVTSPGGISDAGRRTRHARVSCSPTVPGPGSLAVAAGPKERVATRGTRSAYDRAGRSAGRPAVSRTLGRPLPARRGADRARTPSQEAAMAQPGSHDAPDTEPSPSRSTGDRQGPDAQPGSRGVPGVGGRVRPLDGRPAPRSSVRHSDATPDMRQPAASPTWKGGETAG